MPMSKKQNEKFIEAESMKIDNKEWNEVLHVNRKKLLKVFLAGAIVATVIWLLVFYIYIKTGFIL